MFNLEYIRCAETFFALQVPIYYYVKTKGSLCTQDIGISKTVRMKLGVFEYYNQFYKTVLSEEEYEKCRLKIYRFLIDAAQDGAVSPAAVRLGDERVRVPSGILMEEGVLFDRFRERKLLDYYLEAAALKNGLTLQEIRLLLYLRQAVPGSRKELADLAGLSVRALSVLLKRLSAKGLLQVTEARVPESGKKQLQAAFLPAAGAVLKDLEHVLQDFEEARLSGFSQEERAQYAALSKKVRENVRETLS